MHRFEMLDESRIRALGTTRAGLFIAALKGMCAATTPRFTEGTERVERPFKIEAPDSEALLVAVLNEALSLSNANREAYEDVSFSLITDKKAEGAFVGRPVNGFEMQIKAALHPGLEVKKNDEGSWEAVVTFEMG
ncbi:MAG TPA: archease [Candidatus Methylomirabilis sp.]|nr:archease [Candidatus Methylomirabilis sp.]